MRIEELHLKNFCGFEELTIQFPESNLAVFIGNNGSGKTTILKSMVLLLSWLIARIEREKGLGSPISDLEILNGTSFSEIKIKIKNNNELFEWSLAKTAKGKKKQVESKLIDTTKLADIYRTQYTKNDDSSFPLIIYYPVERSVLDVPLKIRTKHNFSQLDGYDNALSQGVDFRRFFEWFREREDIENEHKNFILNEGLELLEDRDKFSEKYQEYRNYKEPQINAVRRAIELFTPSFSNLRIERKPLRMVVNKGKNKPLNILQLSQGEKSLMALVGDIARRLAMMNPTLENPLEGTGIVLIDEIELHLHPNWQRSVIPNLQKTFPNIQFIVTTHSPLVLASLKNGGIYELMREGDTVKSKAIDNIENYFLNDIVKEFFDVDLNQEKVNHVDKEKQAKAKKLLLNLVTQLQEDE